MSFLSKTLDKFTHLNNLDLIALKYKQAALDAEIKNQPDKAGLYTDYSERLQSAAAYIIAMYDSEERAGRLNSDLLRTIATQEYEIQTLRDKVLTPEKIINSIE